MVARVPARAVAQHRNHDHSDGVALVARVPARAVAQHRNHDHSDNGNHHIYSTTPVVASAHTHSDKPLHPGNPPYCRSTSLRRTPAWMPSWSSWSCVCASSMRSCHHGAMRSCHHGLCHLLPCLPSFLLELLPIVGVGGIALAAAGTARMRTAPHRLTNGAVFAGPPSPG